MRIQQTKRTDFATKTPKALFQMTTFRVIAVIKHLWPSGLRRCIKAAVSSDAWVQIPPDAFFACFVRENVSQKPTNQRVLCRRPFSGLLPFASSSVLPSFVSSLPCPPTLLLVVPTIVPTCLLYHPSFSSLSDAF